MDKDLLRLELLKLTYRAIPQLAAEEAIAQAKKLEDFVLESGAEKLEQSPAQTKPFQSWVKK